MLVIDIATTGDFSLTANEVGPVVKTLRDQGIGVTALHMYMLTDDPHLFYVHSWAVGDPAKVASGVKAALDHVNIM